MNSKTEMMATETPEPLNAPSRVVHKYHTPQANVRVEHWPQTSEDAEELTIHVSGEAVDSLKLLLQQASNCRWESLSDDMRWMMDILVFGKQMPSHRDRGTFN